MKRLVMVSGAPGVGKSALCRQLFQMIEGCAWLDADWCWMVNPWMPKTSAQEARVEQTFSRILREYFEADHTNTVLFSWVMRSDWMFNLVTDPLADIEMEISRFVLICNRDVHIKRMREDRRRQEQINSPHSMEEYLQLAANVIDNSCLSVEATARMVLGCLSEGT